MVQHEAALRGHPVAAEDVVEHEEALEGVPATAEDGVEPEHALEGLPITAQDVAEQRKMSMSDSKAMSMELKAMMPMTKSWKGGCSLLLRLAFRKMPMILRMDSNRSIRRKENSCKFWAFTWKRPMCSTAGSSHMSKTPMATMKMSK